MQGNLISRKQKKKQEAASVKEASGSHYYYTNADPALHPQLGREVPLTNPTKGTAD